MAIMASCMLYYKYKIFHTAYSTVSSSTRRKCIFTKALRWRRYRFRGVEHGGVTSSSVTPDGLLLPALLCCIQAQC
eukprot:1182122-Prorocentrum_minimum.AAC.3